MQLLFNAQSANFGQLLIKQGLQNYIRAKCATPVCESDSLAKWWKADANAPNHTQQQSQN